ncbi:uncharacterized protein MELLADRAFT_104236 [Melampsora larici-populina 98AG31]|uniref:Secreted protein n=1 Tax=Melampsora larici-populina (strain 98AG31 / pathotype 3-4-7) TaxID=747676 RepID=F4RE16_MELLP|nr:uncharacterized protein MELLADRAFT_104236 [Melampsora larici-populina 98AG31]EGG09519.1 hypothetical protein MELLADRAFT_104236 [Melampsora larici-populina 98AG31]
MLIQITLLPAFILALATSVISSSATEKPMEKSAIGISTRSQKPLARCPSISTEGETISIPTRQNDSRNTKLSYITNNKKSQEHHGIQNKPSKKLASLNPTFQINMINQKSELLKILYELNGENLKSDQRGIHQESFTLTRKPRDVTTHVLGVPVTIRGFSSKKLKLAIA